MNCHEMSSIVINSQELSCLVMSPNLSTSVKKFTSTHEQKYTKTQFSKFKSTQLHTKKVHNCARTQVQHCSSTQVYKYIHIQVGSQAYQSLSNSPDQQQSSANQSKWLVR